MHNKLAEQLKHKYNRLSIKKCPHLKTPILTTRDYDNSIICLHNNNTKKDKEDIKEFKKLNTNKK